MSQIKAKLSGHRFELILAAAVLCGPSAQIASGEGTRQSTNLAVTAVASKKSNEKSSIVTFTVTVTNDGPADAVGVLLETIADQDVLIQLSERHARAGKGIRCHSKIMVCEIGDLAAKDSVKIQFVTEVATRLPTTIGLEFRVASETIDAMPFDNRYYSSTFLSGS